jgi:hypothetical protein
LSIVLREAPGAFVPYEASRAAITEDERVRLLHDFEDEVDTLRKHHEGRHRLLLHNGPSGRTLADNARTNIRHEARYLFVVGENGQRH